MHLLIASHKGLVILSDKRFLLKVIEEEMFIRTPLDPIEMSAGLGSSR